MAKNIVKSNINNVEYTTRPFGTCTTQADIAAKVVTCADFALTTGATILVKFSYSNTSWNTTLNVNNSGDKSILCNGNNLQVKDSWKPEQICEFYYNGTNWEYINSKQYNIKYHFKATEVGAFIPDMDINLVPIVDGNSDIHMDVAQYNDKICQELLQQGGFIEGDIISVYFSAPESGEEWMGVGYEMGERELQGVQMNESDMVFTICDLYEYEIVVASYVYVNAPNGISIPTASLIQSSNMGFECPVLQYGSTYLFQYLDSCFVLMGYNPNGIQPHFEVNYNTGGSTVSVSRNLTSGTKIASISIDGNSQDLYCKSGTVTSVATGKGLTGGTITSTGTIKCNLNSETSLGTLGTTSNLYAVGVDANNKLAVSVPVVNIPEKQLSHYAICSTAATTAAKTVSISTITNYYDGLIVHIKLTNGNSASNPTLNINGLGAVTLLWNGNAIQSSATLTPYNVYTLVYDASATTKYWRIVGGIDVEDTKVTQTIAKSGYTNWRSLLAGAQSSATQGFTPSTTTDFIYATYAAQINPASGDIVTTGKISATNGFFETSDERLKNFENKIDVSLDKISSLKKNYFTWKENEDSSLQIGVSAQEIQKLYPELVSETDNGTLTVAYDKLSVVALAAIDKLYEENKELKTRLEQLENKLK